MPLAEQAVLQSKAFTEEEALKATPPLIDVIATDVRDLLKKIDGRTVTRFDGRTVTLRTASATIVPVAMTLRQRILSAVAHPNVAYILLTLGTLGLTIELWTPGAILPGVVGGLSLLLAFFALQVLPINYAGLLLMLFGLVLLALEVKVTSFGLLAAGGIVSLIFGSMMLIDSPAPEMQLSISLILSVVLGFTAIAAFLVRLGARRPANGAGERRRRARHRSRRGADVDCAGTCRAACGFTAKTGSRQRTKRLPPAIGVRVLHVEGLTLTVRKE